MARCTCAAPTARPRRAQAPGGVQAAVDQADGQPEHAARTPPTSRWPSTRSTWCCAERPDVVAIASSDSDFAPLVARLREKGCRVVGIGQEGKTGDETLAGLRRVHGHGAPQDARVGRVHGGAQDRAAPRRGEDAASARPTAGPAAGAEAARARDAGARRRRKAAGAQDGHAGARRAGRRAARRPQPLPSTSCRSCRRRCARDGTAAARLLAGSCPSCSHGGTLELRVALGAAARGRAAEPQRLVDQALRPVRRDRFELLPPASPTTCGCRQPSAAVDRRPKALHGAGPAAAALETPGRGPNIPLGLSTDPRA
ncbi:MAG: NYN domain-containing protein [Comamonadaceae bacterium]|nr:NYN domain-containing protein [Comamonadaceae bacterium]